MKIRIRKLHDMWNVSCHTDEYGICHNFAYFVDALNYANFILFLEKVGL